MATRAKRAIYREVTAVRIDGRSLIVGILPSGHVSVRPKGRRHAVEAPALWVFEAWARIEKRAERMRRRRERREARIAAQNLMALGARGDGG